MSEYLQKGYIDFGTAERFAAYKSGASELNGMLKDCQSKQMQKQVDFIPISDRKSGNKTGLLVGTGVVVGAAITLLVIKVIIWSKNKKQQAFAEAYTRYINEIKLGNATVETIDNFIKCLRKVTDKKGKLKLEITPNELADFIESIKSITLSMAEKNNVTTEKLYNSLEETVIMFDIEHLLEMQKNMIRKLA